MKWFYIGFKEKVKDELSKDKRSDILTQYIEKTVEIDNRLYKRRMERRGYYLHLRWTPAKQQSNTGKRIYHHSTATGIYPGPIDLGVTTI